MGNQRYNAVCDRLAKGNGSIKGMKLLLPISPHGSSKALVEVTVIGIDFDNCAYGRGVNITVEPAHGAGRLSVPSTELVDDTEAARQRYWRMTDAAKYSSDHMPHNGGVRELRNALIAGRNRLDKAQRETFDQRASERLGSGKEPDKCMALIAKGEEYALKEVWQALLQVMFNLEQEEVRDD